MKMNLLHVDRNTYLSRILDKSSFHNVIVFTLLYSDYSADMLCENLFYNGSMDWIKYWTRSNI